MSKINFIDVALAENKKFANDWTNHDYKCIIAFEDEVAFENWKKIMNNLAEINQILKPNTIGLGYKIVYHKCKYNVQIRHLVNNLLCPSLWPIDDINAIIKEYEKRYWMFVGFSYQKYCYDPIDSCMKRFIDFIDYNEDAEKIDFDKIGMHIIVYGKE